MLQPLECPCPPLSPRGDPRPAAHRAPRRHPAPDHGHAADERHAASRDVILCVRRAHSVRTGGARDPAHGRLAGARLVGQGKGWRQVGGRAGPRWDPGTLPASLAGKGTATFDAGARAHVCVHHC